MDILFVIDDSGSMEEEQANLASNFPGFITAIEGWMNDDGAAIDYRIGVTTTGRDVTTVISFGASFPLPPMMISETGDNGQLRQECGMTRRWMERSDGDVATTFPCVAMVGTSGPGVEMPLLATEMALVDRVSDGVNTGFIREDALLAIVVITDEDDCSRRDDPIMITLDVMMPGVADVCDSSSPTIEPLTRFLDVLDGIKGSRGRWAVAVTAGETSCTSAFGDATAAPRLQEFVRLAGPNAVFSSICEGNLVSALDDAFNTFEIACEEFPPLI